LVIAAVAVAAQSDSRALLEKARAALDRNHLAEAKNAARKALEQDAELGDAEVILGLIATAGKDLGSAEKHFARAVELQPKNPRVHGYLGSTYLAQQRLPEAATAFNKVLHLEPSNAAAQHNLGVIAMIGRNPEIAAGHFRSVVRANPRDAAALAGLLQAGLALAAAENYADAVPILEQVQAASPSSDTVYNLGLALFRAGKVERAIQVLQPFERSAQALNLLGTILESRRRYPEAILAMSRAAKLEPSNEDYRLDHAALLIRDANSEPAIQAFQEARGDFPSSLRARLGLGSAYYLAGRYEDAANALLEALAPDASAPLVYRLLARVYESATQHQQKIQSVFREYLGRKPNDAGAYLAYGTMFASVDVVEAKRRFEQALVLDPQLSDAHLQLGILAQNEGDMQQAIQSFTKAVKLAPGSAQAHYRLATALAKTGDVDGSRSEMATFQQLRAKERESEKEQLARSLGR
jgi:tetratricopeptide (TPR) repeat protein